MTSGRYLRKNLEIERNDKNEKQQRPAKISKPNGLASTPTKNEDRIFWIIRVIGFQYKYPLNCSGTAEIGYKTGEMKIRTKGTIFNRF